MAADDDRTHVGERLRCLEHCALHRRTIALTCPSCRRERRYDAVALWWLFARRGWPDTLPEAYARLYCEACRAASGRKVRPRAAITRDPPDADQPPYPSERAWRRIVARYRS